jgi:hypothetical protein
MRMRVRARDVVKVVMLGGLIAELTLTPVAQAADAGGTGASIPGVRRA